MTLIIYRNSDNEVLHAVKGSGLDSFSSVCLMMGLGESDHTGIIYDGDCTTKQAQDLFSILGGVLVDRAETLSEAQQKKFKEVKRKYRQLCEGTDPETGNDIYVDCVTDSGTFRMNAGKEAAKSMDEGVRIFERSGATHMPIVRDFNNTNHLNVPLADAISISLQQGVDALNHWRQKGGFVDAINAATTVAEVEAIDIIFMVNTE